MVILINGEIDEKIGSEVHSLVEEIEIHYETTKTETEFYEIENEAKILLEKISIKGSELIDLRKQRKFFENLEELKKLRNKYINNKLEIEEGIKLFKSKTQNNYIFEQQEKYKKDLKVVDEQIILIEEKIKEVKKYSDTKERETLLLKAIKSMTLEYQELNEIKKRIRKKLKLEENKIQVIEYLVKKILSKGGNYSIEKYNTPVKQEYYRLTRKYAMKDNSERSFDKEYNNLEDFLKRFGIDSKTIVNISKQETQLKKLRSIKKAEKKSLTKKINGKKGKKGKKGKNGKARTLNFEKAEDFKQKISSLKSKIKQTDEETIKEIKSELNKLDKLKQKKVLEDVEKKLIKNRVEKKYKKNVETIKNIDNSIENLVANIEKQNNEMLHKKSEAIEKEVKEIEEQIKIEKEAKEIEEQSKISYKIKETASKVINKIKSFFSW